MMGNAGLGKNIRGDNILVGDIKNMSIGTAAHELGHAKQSPAWLNARQLGMLGPGLTPWYIAGTRDEDRARNAAIAGGLAGVPMVANEANASARGYSVLRRMGKSMPTSMRAFGGVPSYAALLAAPYLTYSIKKHFGGYKAKPEPAYDAENDDIFKQGEHTVNYYDQGFNDKCAEYGIDPVQLRKTAGWLQSLMRGAKAFGGGAKAGLGDLHTTMTNLLSGQGLHAGLSKAPSAMGGKSLKAWQAGNLAVPGLMGGAALTAPFMAGRATAGGEDE
jgi:hypothetical protein